MQLHFHSGPLNRSCLQNIIYVIYISYDGRFVCGSNLQPFEQGPSALSLDHQVVQYMCVAKNLLVREFLVEYTIKLFCPSPLAAENCTGNTNYKLFDGLF